FSIDTQCKSKEPFGSFSFIRCFVCGGASAHPLHIKCTRLDCVAVLIACVFSDLRISLSPSRRQTGNYAFSASRGALDVPMLDLPSFFVGAEICASHGSR